MRRLRRILLALAVLGALAAASLALYVSSLDVDVLGDPIARQLSRTLGRDVSIGRVVEWGELLRPRLVLEDVVVRASVEDGGSQLARVARATVGLDLSSLLQGTARVESMTTEGVSLTIDVDGEGHWIWAAARDRASAADPGEGFEIEDVDVESARVTYRDARTGETVEIAVDHLSFALSPAAVEVELVGELGARRFDLAGRFVPRGPPGGLRGPFDGVVAGRVDDVEVELEGEVGTLLELGSLDLELRARGIELPLPPELLGGAGLGPASLTGRLTSDGALLSLSELGLSASAPGGSEVSVTGRLGDLTGAVDVDLELAFTGSARTLPGLFAEQLPEALAPLRVSARARGTGTELDLEDVVLELGEPGAGRGLRVEGAMRDPLGLPVFEGEGEVRLADARLLPALSALPPASLEGAARIRATGSAFRLEDLALELRERAGLRLELRGDVTGSGDAYALELDASLQAGRLAALGRLLERELPDLGPVSGVARLRGSGWDVDAEGVELEVGSAGDVRMLVTGDVRDLGGEADARLELRLEAASTGRLATWLETDLPELGSVEAHAALDASRSSLRVESVSLRTVRADGLTLVAEGEMHGASLGDEIDVSFELAGPDLAALGELVDVPLPSLGPLRASGRLYSSSDGSFAVHGLEARLGASELRGSFSRDAEGRLRADLSADALHLGDLVPRDGAPEEEEVATNPWQRELPLLELPDVDLDLVLRVGSLEGRAGLTVEQVSLHAVLSDRVLTLTPLDFQLEGAPTRITGGVDAGDSPPRLWLRARGEEVDLDAVAAQFTDQEVASGRARVRADLRSRGRTPTELVDALGGEFSLVLRHGRISTGAVVLLQRHLLQALAFRDSLPESAHAECLVADFDLDQGVASTRTLLVDGRHALLHGQGTIDLRRGTLDLMVTPRAKSPRLFAVHVPVHVTGRYDDPVARPQRRSLASHAAVALVGNLLVPGVGLLAPFVKVGSLGSDPCTEAIEAFLEPR